VEDWKHAQRRRGSVARHMARARGGVAWVLAAAWVLWAAAAEARSPAGRRVHRHLKRLNKPAVKSIEVGGCSAVRGIRNDGSFF